MSILKQVTLPIEGMTCAACSTRIEKVLNKMDGVDAKVNLTTEQAAIVYDSDKVTVDDLEHKNREAGLSCQGDTK